MLILFIVFTVRNELAKVMFLQACVCPHRGSGGVFSGGECLLSGGSAPGGDGIPACTEADPPGETATAADGTHPTGMHSCYTEELQKFYSEKNCTVNSIIPWRIHRQILFNFISFFFQGIKNT